LNLPRGSAIEISLARGLREAVSRTINVSTENCAAKSTSREVACQQETLGARNFAHKKLWARSGMQSFADKHLGIVLFPNWKAPRFLFDLDVNSRPETEGAPDSCVSEYPPGHHSQQKRDHLLGDLQLPNDCVIHSFRHTFLTRFGEAGVRAIISRRLRVTAA
jgi:hypothetical protein